MMRRASRAIKQPGAAHFFLQCEENDKKGGIAVNKKQLMIELAMPIVFMLMAVYIIVTAIPMESIPDHVSRCAAALCGILIC